ncbi:hypothetical protein FA95DRAFT_1495931 [Auriscalpium vulgare]|uniref:Uncharacterized protein n=1 Tax=Auriscalpium vulgare TaxID=40419 RepID=A0ACB8RLT6_9AGAM|nr:hypothetical protein FA95DRAFT_1495931 [Auriscalpium vulgare]
MASIFAAVTAFYEYGLRPIPALALVGVSVSVLDVLGALRVALVMRQVRESLLAEHLATPGAAKPEPRSLVREYASTLLLVYGGEAIIAPWLGQAPSFFVSPAIPTLYILAHVFVDTFSTVPALSLNTELPAGLIDAFTRGFLLTQIVPTIITSHPSPEIANSPWALLLTSTVRLSLMTNTGLFVANATGLLKPTALSLTTPPEFLPGGWAAVDLWAGPLIAGMYATLTHAQPFFADLHAVFYDFWAPLGLARLSFADGPGGTVAPLSVQDAQAACVIVLGTIFSVKAIKTFGNQLGLGALPDNLQPAAVEKELVANAGKEAHGVTRKFVF